MNVRPAVPSDLHELLDLLRAAALPEAGVAEHFPAGFVVARGEDGALLGAAGLEAYDGSGLLRSVVVSPEQRGTGLGQRLSREVVSLASARGVRDLYLLTTTAEGFFPRLGFEAVRRDALPEALGASAELRGACPASAVAMRLSLSV